MYVCVCDGVYVTFHFGLSSVDIVFRSDALYRWTETGDDAKELSEGQFGIATDQSQCSYLFIYFNFSYLYIYLIIYLFLINLNTYLFVRSFTKSLKCLFIYSHN